MWPLMEKLSTGTSQSTQMILVAAVASAATATAILSYQGAERRHHARHSKKRSEGSMGLSSAPSQQFLGDSPKEQDTGSNAPATGLFDEELVQEQLARNIAFLGEDGVAKLRKSFVIVVGAGDIGSWAATMLVKSGVGRIRMIDYGTISLSNLHQHSTATRRDVGTPKAIALKRTFRKVVPWVDVDVRIELLREDTVGALLAGSPDYVVDATGDLTSKLALLKYCYENKIPVISAMDAGVKADPSRVQISDISETIEDPLARAVRRRMKRLGVDIGIEIVFSTEKPTKSASSMLPGSEEKPKGLAYNPLPIITSGTTVLPTLVPIPAMFGMSMATHIICKIAGWPMDPLLVRYRDVLYQRLHRDLKLREESMAPTGADDSQNSDESRSITMPLDRRDIGYVVEEMFRGRSGISQSMDRICVCRWIRSEPLSLLNAVVLTQAEMERHLALPEDADLEKEYGKSIVDSINGRYEEEILISRLR
ncbi:hypothetical protein BGW38_008216 [Lunasporangiospora selenospora]|uniref:THIF-type NAD/FAD binding fold domain-containing protein n=1 Tax=Lunasporangiospora selenospora TaxID=979761 RepID=A0A9P6G327_9FUNG|nr:hypothetical protein BGW38_008216 [Lunasporangiospora selenospora]